MDFCKYRIVKCQQYLALAIQVRDTAGSTRLRGETLGRYEYVLYCRNSQYFVTCQDSEKEKNRLTFGPFTLEEANDMIDSRVQRHEELKRE